MKKHASLKILCGMAVGAVALILFNAGNAGEQVSQIAADPNNINAAIASQFNDNIRDVSARLAQTEKKMNLLDEQNKRLAAQNAELTATKESGGVVVRETVSPEVLATMDSLKSELEAMKAFQEAGTASVDYPLTAGGSKNDVNLSGGKVLDIDAQIMKRPLSENEARYWQAWNEKKRQLHKKIHRPSKIINDGKEAPKAIPYYTIPAGSDLGNTTLLTALIGEVPIDGKLMQPLFPFSGIISRGDLMASNGIELPEDITGMKVSGYAIGVGSFLDNISCVRAYVTSALFTFQDGHFVVVGKEQMSSSVDLVNNDSLGYLTTPHGNPCIHGKYYTNAPTVLAAMLAAGGVNGAGKALSQWQMTYFAGPEGGAAIPTGSLGAYAAGGALSEGSVKVADWLEKRIQGSFDMVFVPASEPTLINGAWGFRINRMSLHITQTIELDKQLEGRVLNYGRKQRYTHDFSLR